MFSLWCIFPFISSQPEGALPGTLWNVGVGAAPEGGSKRSSPFAGVLGYPSGPTVGVCHRSWLDGDRQRREIAVRQVPGSADQGYYAATERREAWPCASVSRRSGKQAAAVTLPRCAFRRSASLLL